MTHTKRKKAGSVFSPHLCNNVHNKEEEEEKKETVNSICFMFMQWRASEEETTERYSPHIYNDLHQIEETANGICPIHTMTYIRRMKPVRPTSMQWHAQKEETTKLYSPHTYNDLHQKEETTNGICPISTTTEGGKHKQHSPHTDNDLHQQEETTKQYKHSPHIYIHNDVHQKEETINI